MNDIKFASIRLGKTSVQAIKDLYAKPSGITTPFIINVVCTQVPQELTNESYVFIWLGSDNSKGSPTEWKQGYKAFGKVKSVIFGKNYNDETTTTVEILYLFADSINRLDFLKIAAESYYDCSALPIIGLDDHSNQTIRLIQNNGERMDIPAMFYSLNRIDDTFENSIVRIDSRLSDYFDYLPPSLQSINSHKQVLGKFLNTNRRTEFLTALRTKPFMLLAGISGTGKSRIVRKLAQATVTEALQRKYDMEYKGEDFANDRWKLHSPANFQLIQVKPNWHNSMDVVGYLSNIPSPHYVFTPFINFVVKAWLNPDVPFFLCLDEMNLAPVEEYFAEFLSAIESRSFENGEYMTDPIIKPFDEFGNGIGVSMIKELNDALKTPMDKEVEQHLRNRGLTLPKNLLVIGTVNMDETTFSFSRKVLDRAMSIEMNEVDYGSFLSSNTDEDLHAIVSAFSRGEYKKPNGTPLTLNELLVERHIEAGEVTSELGGAADGSVAKSVICYLETINHLLEGTPFKLGYRAANEALIYVRSAQEFGMTDVASALDSFTLMKILSRIEGDESKLRLTDSVADSRKLTKCGIEPEEATKYGELTILTALREIIKDNLGEYREDDRPNQPEAEEEDQSTGTDREQRRSIQKIDQMISQLARDHFVSYWN